MSAATLSAYLVVESEGQQHRLPLGFSQISAVLYDLPEADAPPPMLALLSRHPASSVRRSLVDRFPLPVDVVRTFETDPCHEVVRSLVLGNAENRGAVSTETVLRVLDASVDAAGSIARSLEDYASADRKVLEAALVGHPDPEVRVEAARHLKHKRQIKVAQTRDADPQVRNAAAD